MTEPVLFDPGLQPERTSLAWRRTALAVTVGSLVSLRLLPAALGDAVWCLPGVIGVLFAGWMWWFSRRRHTAFVEQLGTSEAEPIPGGAAPLLVMSAFTVVFGALALLVALFGQR